MIIELLYGSTKFKSILTKSYFIDSKSINDNESMPKNFILTPIQIPIIEAPAIEKGLAEIPLTKKLPIHIPAISIPLASLVLVKCNRRQLKKYPEQVNIAS